MGQQSLEEQISELLLKRGWTICAAESCTGGLMMHRLTNVPGSSPDLTVLWPGIV